jgi:hypothetical protein
MTSADEMSKPGSDHHVTQGMHSAYIVFLIPAHAWSERQKCRSVLMKPHAALPTFIDHVIEQRQARFDVGEHDWPFIVHG